MYINFMKEKDMNKISKKCPEVPMLTSHILPNS